jgi:hypothetical protein
MEPGTNHPVIGRWVPIVTPDQWAAVCATFGEGSLYLHRGSGAPRLTEKKVAPRHLAGGILRCGAQRGDDSLCNGALCAQKGRSKKSPYVYSCRDCRHCSISGPLADEALEALVLSADPGRARLSESVRGRWLADDLPLDEKRKIVASVLTCCLVRPGVKGQHAWDHSRVTPVWR